MVQGRLGVGGAQHLRAEHRVVDARHHRCVVGQGVGHGQPALVEVARHVLEVHLVEDALWPVSCQRGQRLKAQVVALGEEAAQVRLVGEHVGRVARQAAPQRRVGRVGLVGDEPAQQAFQHGGVRADGEETGALQVVRVDQFVGAYAARCQPFGDGALQEVRRRRRHVAAEGIRKTVGTQGIGRLVHRHHIHAHPFRQVDGPRVGRDARQHMAGVERPAVAQAAVFEPYPVERGVGAVLRHHVLREDGAVALHALLDDEALVLHAVLYGPCRGYHLLGGAEVVKLAPFKRHDGHAQAAGLLVGRRRVTSQGAAQLTVQVVGREAVCGQRLVRGLGGGGVGRGAAACQHLDGAVGEQPQADVHQGEVGGHEGGLHLGRRLLQHEVERRGVVAVYHEYAVVGRLFGIAPKAEAYHVGLGDGLERGVAAQIHVAAGHQRAQTLRRLLHDVLEERHLQVQQRLTDALSALPAEDGHGGEHLAARRIGRQAPALSGGVQQDAALARQPFGEGRFRGLGAPQGFQQPDGAAAAPQTVTDGVGSAKITIGGQSCHVVEAFHDMRGEGKQSFHDSGKEQVNAMR